MTHRATGRKKRPTAILPAQDRGRPARINVQRRNYACKPLVNPANDARAVASTLISMGFAEGDIHLVLDARRDEPRRARVRLGCPQWLVTAGVPPRKVDYRAVSSGMAKGEVQTISFE